MMSADRDARQAARELPNAGWEVANAAWRGVALVAHDVTTEMRERSAVVLAAHADDETLGCGGTIALKTRAGWPVTVVIATDGRLSPRPIGTSVDELVATRRREASAAAATLGAGEPIHLPFVDGQLHSLRDDLDSSVGEQLRAVAVDQVFAPSPGDPHPDHAALGAAVRRVLSAWAGPAPQLLEYPIWQRVSVRATGRSLVDWRRLVRVDVSTTLPAKRAALACYTSQLPGDVAMTVPPLHPRFTAAFLGRHEVFTRVSP
jgi:LmbE family N-acetylglucosaminyl deacetylase